MNCRRDNLVKTIQHRLKDNSIVALLGPRQIGKTTLARELGKKRSPKNIHLFDLESNTDLTRLQNPELVLSPLKGLIILDEIQRLPEIYPTLRVLADRPSAPAKFLILGSASPDLAKRASESLAGRISFIDVPGLSLEEVGVAKMKNLWWRGGFPRASLARSNPVARQWHEDFFRTFLERDIPQFGINIPANTLRRFWTMVAHYHGQIIQFSELARSLNTSEPTARRHLDILSGTYVVRQLPPWFENLKKRQVKSPKVFIRDSGILHALLGIPDHPSLEAHPKLGASWEGFAMEQIFSISGDRDAYFWATHTGAELDLLLFHMGKRLGMEFKCAENIQVTKSMHIAQKDLGLDHLYIVHPGEHCFPVEDNITATPLSPLLKIL